MSLPHAEIAAMVTFFTRLPARLMGVSGGELADIDLARASRFAPLAGFVVGLAGAVTIAVFAAVGVPPTAAVIVGMLIMILITGGLHEDGLADASDALGANTPERRLEVMRDSRIGVYGAIALWASLSLRAVLLAVALQAGAGILFAALLAAHAISRQAALYLPHALPPARPDGASAAFGRPDSATFHQGLLIAAVVGGIACFMASGFAGTLAVLVVTCGVTILVTRLVHRYFGGQTGDLIGAAQQLVEIAILGSIAIFI